MLTFALFYLGIILILLLFFIFLGIKAFSIGGTFGSVINSIIPTSKINIIKFLFCLIIKLNQIIYLN